MEEVSSPTHIAPPPYHKPRPLSRGSLTSTLQELNDINKGPTQQQPAWEKAPESSARRPFWLMRLLRTTTTTGGFLTPRLYVPRLVWEQYGAKINGLSTKKSLLETLLSLLVDKVLPLELPRDDDGAAVQQSKAARALRVFVGLREELDALQNTLARPFPFIKEVVSLSSSSSSVSPGRRRNVASTTTSSSSSGSSQFNRLVLSIGKTVRKSAVSAYTAIERINVAVAAKITDEELVEYAALVGDVCDKAQALDEWYVHLDARRKERGQNGGVGGGGGAAVEALHQLLEDTLVELLQCARFVQEVVVELLLRDLDSLLESYLRKMRKSFARMNWELDETGDS